MEEALQRRTLKDALAGKRMAMREVIKWIKTREAWFAKNAPPARHEIQLKSSLDPDNADAALVLLGIARGFRSARSSVTRRGSFLSLGRFN